MGRRKKVSDTTSKGMGAAFAASVSEKIASLNNEGENSSKALTLQAEKVILQGYIAACLDKVDDEYVLVSDVYRGYMAWTGKYISEESFRDLLFACELGLIVIQHEELFEVSLKVAIDGFKIKSNVNKFAVEEKHG